MKNIFFSMLILTFLISCSKDEVGLAIFNPELTIVENLNNDVSILDLIDRVGIEGLYGLEHGGGFIFHVNSITGELMVARDYTIIGEVAWGDHFDLNTGSAIGDGFENTQLIVDRNADDNSLVFGGFEFGSENYAFKIALDLELAGFDDWFIPSSGSLEAIYNNVHMSGVGDFNESLVYWSSTKDGYYPYVMFFNFESWGGQAFAGSCIDANGLIIARKF
tara:strand:- start:5612 stop:6271 length:660 start_codon:yes stop_codon:yes gene_type:complete